MILNLIGLLQNHQKFWDSRLIDLKLCHPYSTLQLNSFFPSRKLTILDAARRSGRFEWKGRVDELKLEGNLNPLPLRKMGTVLKAYLQKEDWRHVNLYSVEKVA